MAEPDESTLDIHRLLGMGMRTARERQGWRQEDAAKWFRYYGLTTWRRSTVAEIEAGRRHPSLPDLLLAALALRCTVADLIPALDNGASQPIDMGSGATLALAEVRGLLSADWAAVEKVPVAQANRVPGRSAVVAAMRTEVDALDLEQQRVLNLIQPIADAAARELTDGEWASAYSSPSEAEIRAAARIGVEPAQLKLAAHVLWGRPFEDERDGRATQADGESGAVMQARRGHASRAMLIELRTFLANVAKGSAAAVQAVTPRDEAS